MIKAIALLLVATSIGCSIHYHFHGITHEQQAAFMMPSAHLASSAGAAPAPKDSLPECQNRCRTNIWLVMAQRVNECLNDCANMFK